MKKKNFDEKAAKLQEQGIQKLGERFSLKKKKKKKEKRKGVTRLNLARSNNV